MISIRSRAVVLTLILGLLVGAMSVVRLNAQGTSATIQGTVTDASGAAIPDTAVQVKNVGTGIAQSTTTNAAGRFNVPDLGVGEYEVQASKMGFSTVVHKGITLTVGGQSVVDFSLPVGQQQQTVTVEGQVSQVETSDATVGTLTDQTQMHELPLNGRNFEQLILLAPGVQTVSAFTSSGMQGRAAEYSIGGSRPEGQLILLDDENLQNFWNKGMGSVTGSSLGIEAIAEFQTLTNTYTAQFGGNGGVINSVSKSGTNSFHGTAYDFLRNSALDARQFIDPALIPPFRKNQFGGAVGGPIKKDRAFFFTNYEGLRQLRGETNVATVPACNVPGVCTPSFPQASNPTTYNAIVNTLALFPTPAPGTVSGTIGRATEVANQIAHEDYVLARFDYNLSDKDSVFVRYISDKANFIEPFGGGSSIGGGQLLDWTEVDNSHSQFTTVEWRRIITPTLVNVARSSFSRPVTIVATPTGTPPLQFFPSSERTNGLLSITGLSGIGATTPENTSPNTFGEADDVIWTHGAHSARFGVAFTRNQSNVYFPYMGGSSWKFQGLASFLGGGVTAGTGPSSLTFIPLTLANGQAAYNNRDFRYMQVMPYFQDSWKISPKLTADLGLRWEFMTDAVDDHNQLYNITNFATATGFSHVANITSKNPNWTNFAPRVGLAYDPFADHKTSIRAGFGIFYQPYVPADYGTGGYATNPPWSLYSAGLSVPGTIVPVYPNIPTVLQTVIPSGVQGWSWANDKTPYVMQYNFNIQRQITGSTLLTVGYLGSRGVHILGLYEQNPTSLINGLGGALNATGSSLVDNPRENPSLGSFGDFVPTSTHRYNSLQVSLVRRFTHNWQMQVAYTYSKCLDDGSYLGSFNSNAPGGVEDPYRQSLDWGLCPYDITHVLSVNSVYALPFHGNRIVEGWQVSGVLTANTGTPLTILDGIDATGFGSSVSRPNVNPGFTNNPIVGTQAQWFNPAAFSLAPFGTLGNIGRDTVRGPDFNDTDFALLKDTKLTERVRVQFRAEFFNIFNHTNFALPANTLYTGLSGGQPVANPNAGRITSMRGTPRQIQFALKFVF